MMKAIRGAITVTENTEEAITTATSVLLSEIERRNNLALHEVVSVFFTLTPDLDATFPARAARAAGWDAPMLDMQEIPVPASLPRCLRVLVHVDSGAQPRHVYLEGAKTLRRDLEDSR